MSATNDVELVARIGIGDRVALGLIYDRHVRSVFRFALSELHSNEEAEDATQETFLTLFGRARKVRLVDESVLPWLLVTCRNHARNRRRAVSRERERTTSVRDIQSVRTADEPEAGALTAELKKAVALAVSQLSDVDRQLYELCIVGESSYDAAATALGVSHGAVRNRLHRIRTRLQRALALL